MGDRCLVMMASALNRASDLTARYGGACILPGADAGAATFVTEEIQIQIRA